MIRDEILHLSLVIFEDSIEVRPESSMHENKKSDRPSVEPEQAYRVGNI